MRYPGLPACSVSLSRIVTNPNLHPLPIRVSRRGLQMRQMRLLAGPVLAISLIGAGSATPVLAHADGADSHRSSVVAGSGNFRSYKIDMYTYKAVRFVNGGTKVRVIWTGDGAGFCFVGTRSGTGPYRGYERNLASGDSTRRTYTWSEVTSGQRVAPPNWLKKAARKIWRQTGCNW